LQRFRLFILTDLMGEIEPCGCTLEPLGGLARLASRLRARRQDGVQPLLISHGDLRTQAAVSPASLPQLKASARFLQERLVALGLSAAGAGSKDAALGASTLAALTAQSGFPHLRNGATMTAAGGAIALHRGNLKTLRDVASTGTGAALLIVLYEGDIDDARREANGLAKAGASVLILVGDQAGAPVTELTAGLYALRGGQRGQELLEVELHLRRGEALRLHQGSAGRAAELAALDERIAGLIKQRDRAEVAAKPAALIAARTAQVHKAQGQRAALQARPLPVIPAAGSFLSVARISLDTSVSEDRQMKERVQAHHRAISALNRSLENSRACPPAAPPEAARFVGSEPCAACHPAATVFWKSTAHAHAWATLEAQGRTYDYGCVGCHSAGFDQSEGFCRVSEAGSRINVGCENCHGPGSLHVAKGGRGGIRRAVEESTCVRCHHPPHTNTFVFADRLKRILGPGHGAAAK
jgi:hypothetical protein